MSILWINAKARPGMASIYPSNITLNIAASDEIKKAYRLQIGIDDNRNIILKPLGKNEVEDSGIDIETLYELKVKKSYSRISSTPLINYLMENVGFDLDEGGFIKYPTYYDEVNKYLVIKTSKGGNKNGLV
jgi:hypothetical protein